MGAEVHYLLQIVKEDSLETKGNDELKPEYDLSKFKGEVSKYYQQAIAGKNEIHSEIAAGDMPRKRSNARNLKKP